MLEIDNSVAERPCDVALGRKKFLFVGSDSGGDRAAVMYTLIGQPSSTGLDPELYLRAVNQIQDLLHWNLRSTPNQRCLDTLNLSLSRKISEFGRDHHSGGTRSSALSQQLFGCSYDALYTESLCFSKLYL